MSSSFSFNNNSNSGTGTTAGAAGASLHTAPAQFSSSSGLGYNVNNNTSSSGLGGGLGSGAGVTTSTSYQPINVDGHNSHHHHHSQHRRQEEEHQPHQPHQNLPPLLSITTSDEATTTTMLPPLIDHLPPPPSRSIVKLATRAENTLPSGLSVREYAAASPTPTQTTNKLVPMVETNSSGFVHISLLMSAFCFVVSLGLGVYLVMHTGGGASSTVHLGVAFALFGGASMLFTLLTLAPNNRTLTVFDRRARTMTFTRRYFFGCRLDSFPSCCCCCSKKKNNTRHPAHGTISFDDLGEVAIDNYSWKITQATYVKGIVVTIRRRKGRGREIGQKISSSQQPPPSLTPLTAASVAFLEEGRGNNDTAHEEEEEYDNKRLQTQNDEGQGEEVEEESHTVLLERFWWGAGKKERARWAYYIGLLKLTGSASVEATVGGDGSSRSSSSTIVINGAATVPEHHNTRRSPEVALDEPPIDHLL